MGNLPVKAKQLILVMTGLQLHLNIILFGIYPP